MSKKPLLIALIFAFAMSFVSLANAEGVTPTPVPTPIPTPIISITKFSTVDQTQLDVVQFTISVTNLAPNAGVGDGAHTVSGLITLDDPLPANTLWYISASTNFECVPLLGPIYSLHCVTAGLQGRHLNDTRTDFVVDSATVTVQGLRQTCGPVVNTAIITGVDFTGIKRASAIANGYPCPTPTPPPATPTPTSTPTPPPPPIPTESPTIIPLTQVPTAPPTAVTTPKPPNTGTGVASSESSRLLPVEVLGIVMVSLLGLSFVALKRRS